MFVSCGLFRQLGVLFQLSNPILFSSPTGPIATSGYGSSSLRSMADRIAASRLVLSSPRSLTRSAVSLTHLHIRFAAMVHMAVQRIQTPAVLKVDIDQTEEVEERFVREPPRLLCLRQRRNLPPLGSGLEEGVELLPCCCCWSRVQGRDQEGMAFSPLGLGLGGALGPGWSACLTARDDSLQCLLRNCPREREDPKAPGALSSGLLAR